MRIAIFNWRDIRHPQAGGGELYLHEQARRWVAQGCAVDWICAGFAGAARAEAIDGIRIHRLGRKYSVYLLAPWQYARLAKPDVIIDVENGIPFFTPLFTRVPKVLLVHHIHKQVWRRELKWPLSALGAALESYCMPHIYRKCPIITVSKSSKRMLRELFPQNRINIVLNAAGSELRPGEKSAVPELVFVGRLKKYKSIDTLLQALARLKDRQIALNIIGRGDDEARLKRIASELGLERVEFTGYLDEEEKCRYLQRAWMMVNPSMVEGWSITNIEANACGTPVIGADVPGIHDSIRNGVSGILFKHGNADELAEKIAELLDNSDERERLSMGALAWARKFSWDRSAARNLRILESVVKNDE
jgi:glycosyltransferase involved in cell wall biosynthesis